ncbi:carotenoid biosynthesis protein [Sphaerisporangium album]|uniref:Carotenoid biosynthesis protein n=2 Tax=Sphaerisporangium album TaxID=509200 RepID=A0A367EXK0_9ACTN|nr:carotenoid biosynthesis protein [Sphaerisporangium album]
MVVVQVMSGLDPKPVRLTSVVVLLLAASVVAFTSAAHGPRRAGAAFGAAVAAGYAAEWVGIRTGVPFGTYRYTDLLWPRPGGVPVVVAVAWGGMGLAAHAVASMATRTQRRGASTPRRGRLARLAVGALALTAWDLFLDPQMIRLGLWTWAEEGPYRGVPLSDFAGWLVVSLLVMALIDPVLTGTSTGAAAVYTVMAFMETLAFAAVFVPPDPLVAATGGTAMGLFAALAWTRRIRGRKWERRWPWRR